MLNVQLVPLSLIHETWPLVNGYIEDALQWGEDDYTIEQVRQNLADGKWMLVVAVDKDQRIHGAAVINIYNMPNFRVAFVVAIGGRLISSQETYAQLCVLLKSFGANRIRGVARESIARLWKRYNFRERYILVEAEI